MIYFPKNNPMIYDHENITIKKCIRKKKTSEHVINLKLHVSMTDYWNQKETNAPGGDDHSVQLIFPATECWPTIEHVDNLLNLTCFSQSQVVSLWLVLNGYLSAVYTKLGSSTESTHTWDFRGPAGPHCTYLRAFIERWYSKKKSWMNRFSIHLQ